MFSKQNLADFKIEETPHSSGSRKLLADKTTVPSEYFEAFTYGYLPSYKKWSLHKHDNIVEICLVLKGSGTIKDKNSQSELFVAGDRFIFPANIEHEIENTSSETADFLFFRLKSI